MVKADLATSSHFLLIASTERRLAADVPAGRYAEVKRTAIAHYNKWVKYGRLV
jgi:hypothetical protein